MQEILAFLGNDTNTDEDRVAALQQLAVLLEPIDNSNGEPSSSAYFIVCVANWLHM